MIFRRKVLALADAEKVSTTIRRLEILADHLEETAGILEVVVRKMRDEEGEEVQP